MAQGRNATVIDTEPVEGPWQLPAGWRWERLASVGRWGSGGTPKAKTPAFYGGSIPWYKIGDLRDGWTKSPEQTITELGLSQSSAKIVPANALLVAMYGSIGKLGMTSFPCATNQAIAFCIPHLDKVELKWLFYYLLGRRTHLLSLGKGGTQQNISQTVLLQEAVPVPPLDTQRRVVARIDELFTELDDGDAALTLARSDLETYRKSLLKAAVTGELTADWRAANPPAETGELLLQRILADRKARWEADPKNKGKRYQEPITVNSSGLQPLPSGWSWATIDQLVSEEDRSFQSGPFGSNLLHSEFRSTGKLVIGIDNVQDGWFSPGSQNRISNEKFRELIRYRARPKDVLITVMATIGRSCVVPADIEDAIITKHIYRMTIDQRAALPTFVESCFRGCPRTLSDIHGNVQGQTRPGLNKGILQRVAVPLPPLAEQKAILEALRAEDVTDETSDQITAVNARAKSLRQSILAAAFRGELVQ